MGRDVERKDREECDGKESRGTTGGGVVEPYINSTIHAPQEDREKV